MLKALKKLKKLTINKSPKFKKKNTADPTLKEFWNKKKRKILEIKWLQFSFWSASFSSSFFLSPQLLTATFAVVLQFFFFFFSLLIFLILFLYLCELLLTKFNFSEIFSILTYQATHVTNYCPFFSFFFFFLITLLFLFLLFFFSLNSRFKYRFNPQPLAFVLNWSLTFQLCQTGPQPFNLVLKWSLPLSVRWKMSTWLTVYF